MTTTRNEGGEPPERGPLGRVTLIDGRAGSTKRKIAASDWQKDLWYTRDGDVKASAGNLALIIENDPQLIGLFALDEFSNRVVLRRDPPWTGSKREEFADADAFELAAWLSALGRYRLQAKSAAVAEAVEAIARRHKFHPVREYLEALRWDGVPRARSLYAKYHGAAEDAYNSRCSEILLLSAVARVFEPGVKADVMLVLEGRQGARKTSSVRALFGAAWSSEAMESPASKDFYQCLAGRWGVEIGEMESFTKAEVNKVKQALSAQDDTYRASYARYARKYPRQCVFVGTTNDDQYLRDATGARRFLPVRVSVADVEGLSNDRDQIWAEAVAMYRAGGDWWTLPDGAQHEQDARYLHDAWADPIEKWLALKMVSDKYPADLDTRPVEQPPPGIRSTTVSQIMSWALGMDIGKHGKQDQMRVAAILKRAGWTRRLAGASRVTRWYPPDSQSGGDDDVPF